MSLGHISYDASDVDSMLSTRTGLMRADNVDGVDNGEEADEGAVLARG